jgi:hypothetical protein
MIFDSRHTNIQNTLDDFKCSAPETKIYGRDGDKQQNKLPGHNHSQDPTNWKTSIYKKPTFTDMIIPYISNHPAQHKYAAIRFLYNRLNTYNLQKEEFKTEASIIQNIMHNNAFPILPHKPLTPKPTTSVLDKQMTITQTPTQKWVIFTYIGKETTFITNLFRKTNLKVTFRINNTVQKLLMNKKQVPDMYTQSGVYKLTCPDCKKVYVGQTGRSFVIRFNEHKYAFRTNGHTSKFAEHLTEQAHSFDCKTQCRYYKGRTKVHT